MADVEAIKKQLLEAASTLYESSGRRIKCLYPWVLVKVLPKEQRWKDTNIILPDVGRGDKSQNKPVAEGIVLETWEPFWKLVHYRSSAMVTKDFLNKFYPEKKFDPPLEDPITLEVTDQKEVKMESKLAPGDHVLFPAWAGQPGGFLDEKEFRLIQEISDFNPSPIPFSKIEYEQESAAELLKKMVGAAQRDSNEWIEHPEEAIANRIMDEFYVIPKKTEAKTISGV